VGPILAVDADPNATLGLTLGVEVPDTLADLRDRMGEAAQEVNAIPKGRLMDQWLAELLVEDKGFDMLAMGRPEGQKCYCYVNGLLRRYLSLLRNNYACVLVDCEAGMEYISRLVIDDVQALVLVAEPTPVGLTTVRRISCLADSLEVKVHRRILAINKVGQYAPALAQAAGPARPADMGRVVEVPFDPDLAGRCARGEPVDAEAGLAARPAIERLAALCLRAPAEDHTMALHEEPIR
jgi:CO dehydrogenase maturation factor